MNAVVAWACLGLGWSVAWAAVQPAPSLAAPRRTFPGDEGTIARAGRVLLEEACAHLPLPAAMLGKPHVFTLRLPVSAGP